MFFLYLEGLGNDQKPNSLKELGWQIGAPSVGITDNSGAKWKTGRIEAAVPWLRCVVSKMSSFTNADWLLSQLYYWPTWLIGDWYIKTSHWRHWNHGECIGIGEWFPNTCKIKAICSLVNCDEIQPVDITIIYITMMRILIHVITRLLAYMHII